MNRELKPIEMEFIADLSDELINGVKITEPNGDTRYTEESQDKFNEKYDEIESYYLEATRMNYFELQRKTEELQKLKAELMRVTNDLEEFKAWVKEKDEQVYEHAMDGTFGEYKCERCFARTIELFETLEEKVCEECFEDTVTCERCECHTHDYRLYRPFDDMVLCSVCYDDLT